LSPTFLQFLIRSCGILQAASGLCEWRWESSLGPCQYCTAGNLHSRLLTGCFHSHSPGGVTSIV